MLDSSESCPMGRMTHDPADVADPLSRGALITGDCTGCRHGSDDREPETESQCRETPPQRIGRWARSTVAQSAATLTNRGLG